jgi:hypothetical protein
MDSPCEIHNWNHRERLLRASQTPLEERLLLGPVMFDLGWEMRETFIRHMHPDADEETIQAMIRHRDKLDRILNPSG